MQETGETPLNIRGSGGLPFRYTAADAIAAANRRGCKTASVLCLNIDRDTLLNFLLTEKASPHARFEPGVDLWNAKYDPEKMRFEIQDVGSKGTAEDTEGGQGGDDGGNGGHGGGCENLTKRARRC